VPDLCGLVAPSPGSCLWPGVLLCPHVSWRGCAAAHLCERGGRSERAAGVHFRELQVAGRGRAPGRHRGAHAHAQLPAHVSGIGSSRPGACGAVVCPAARHPVRQRAGHAADASAGQGRETGLLIIGGPLIQKRPLIRRSKPLRSSWVCSPYTVRLMELSYESRQIVPIGLGSNSPSAF
jgi:hypothetical protein